MEPSGHIRKTSRQSRADNRHFWPLGTSSSETALTLGGLFLMARSLV